MFLIECPWCKTREADEFSCHGEAHIARPTNSHKMDDKEWGDYVFFRTNPKGVHYERWSHDAGCRRWFNVARDTISDKILAVYKIGDKRPTFDAPAKKTATKKNTKK